jgi:mono/diheme cytochrome c family protein
MQRTPCSLLLCALAAAPAVGGAAEPTSRAPDPRHGESLYVGEARLAAGGAPCLACHGIAGHGLARAASFGPDLSGAHAQYGAEALDGVLEDVVFPTMQPVYRDRAITKEERADLVAFLAEARDAGPARLGPGFAAGVAAAMAGFLALVVAVGKGRRARRAGRTP